MSVWLHQENEWPQCFYYHFKTLQSTVVESCMGGGDCFYKVEVNLPLKHIFRWSGRETRMWSARRVTPMFSSRLTTILSSKKPGWQTRATTRVWPKTLLRAAKAPPPRSWSMVGDDFFQQVSKGGPLYTNSINEYIACMLPHFHINLCMFPCMGDAWVNFSHQVLLP